MVILLVVASSFMFFFFNDTATTEIYTLSLHDALPISLRVPLHRFFAVTSVILMLVAFQLALTGLHELSEARWLPSRSEEHTSELQSRQYLVCRLLLDKNDKSRRPTSSRISSTTSYTFV